MVEVTQNAAIPQWKGRTQISQQGILGQNNAKAMVAVWIPASKFTLNSQSRFTKWGPISTMQSRTIIYPENFVKRVWGHL